MLVLSRKVNERIVIGDRIEIVVTHIGRDKVNLGIAAPAEVRVVRSELRKKEGPTP
jgi:carbon storage regulator